MAGFRKESVYITKFGEEIGKEKYKQVVTARESRAARRSPASNDTVQCLLCNRPFKRITKTHLKYSCTESITTEEYLHRFPDSKIIADGLKKLYSNTKESIINKYGTGVGEEKWAQYQQQQALTNTFEYKAEKYNLSENEFDQYNKSRAATLQNFICRYGEDIGLHKWDDYCERQRYTTTIEYFIEKSGNELGVLQYQNFCIGRNMGSKLQSKIELAAFNELMLLLEDLQLSIRLPNPHIGPYDYGNLITKKLVEFYGTYWHADPRFFKNDHMFTQKNQTADQIHSRDQAKRTYAINQGFQVFVIWEHDWCKNKATVLRNIKEWYAK